MPAVNAIKNYLFQNKKFAVAFLAIFWLMISLITVYRTRHGSNDFDTFYAAGKSVLHGEGIYYTGEFYQENTRRSPFLYPPAAACFFALFAFLPMVPAAVLWNTLNFIFMGTCALMLKNYWAQGYQGKQNSTVGRDQLLAAVVVLAVFVDNLTMAQADIFVFFLTVVALLAGFQKREFLGGIILSFAIFMKVTPLLFCLYFLMKRAWKTLLGVFVGSILLMGIIPTLVLGPSKNILYHRQWLGRMIKPVVNSFLKKEDPSKLHPLAKTPEQIEASNLDNLLVEKNQSLSAALTRLFLKNRNAYAFDAAHPVYAARRYARLPVIFGGIGKKHLEWVIRFIQFAALFLLIIIWGKRAATNSLLIQGAELSMVFLSTFLFAPYFRTHQFARWFFPLSVIIFNSLPRQHILEKYSGVWCLIQAACVIYLLQSLPYAKAAGFGMIASLLFWFSFAWMIFREKFQIPSCNV